MTGEEYRRPAIETARPHGSDEISLAQILAIIWRRRAIILVLTLAGLVAGVVYGLVVTPLYLGTATIRPGITAFSPQGGPVREWRLKDITRWYDRRLYAEGVGEAIGAPSGSWAGDIRSDFIARGSQSLQGGDVVTLTALAVSPQEAVKVLDASIEAFKEYAMTDSVSNGLALTRTGLEIQIDDFQNQLQDIDTRKELLNLDIQNARNDLKEIQIDQQIYELKVREVQASSKFREEGISDLDEEISSIRSGLVDVNAAIREMRDQGPDAAAADSMMARAGSDPMVALALSGMLAERGESISRLLESLDAHSSVRFSEMLADSLRYQREMDALAIEDLSLNRNKDLTRKQLEIELRIRRFEIERDQKLEFERRSLQQNIQSSRAQLSMLSPLEKVGTTMATDKPIRPRRLRAVLLLGLVALIGSVCLAFGWDYLSRNRSELFSGGADRA